MPLVSSEDKRMKSYFMINWRFSFFILYHILKHKEKKRVHFYFLYLLSFSPFSFLFFILLFCFTVAVASFIWTLSKLMNRQTTGLKYNHSSQIKKKKKIFFPLGKDHFNSQKLPPLCTLHAFLFLYMTDRKKNINN